MNAWKRIAIDPPIRAVEHGVHMERLLLLTYFQHGGSPSMYLGVFTGFLR